MKENKYDDPSFFEQYNKMARSEFGLDGAGEWYILKTMLPPFEGKTVLDLGCGFGWHCRYAIENGAKSVIGVDISEKMLQKAKVINNLPGIEYLQKPVEEIDFPPNTFDIVLSSLTFHYIHSFEEICRKIYHYLRPGGSFIFSVEHPVFTAYGNQDWIYDEKGNCMHWPVDNYFIEGRRETVFLGEHIVKYHKTLTTYLNNLLKCNFRIKEVIEPQPDDAMLREIEGMKDEIRRPMMLLISTIKE